MFSKVWILAFCEVICGSNLSVTPCYLGWIVLSLMDCIISDGLRYPLLSWMDCVISDGLRYLGWIVLSQIALSRMDCVILDGLCCL